MTKEYQDVLPLRGTVHDMEPTLTHKALIIEKLFVRQETVQQVIRETCHSARAIERYITSFKQVLMCRRKGMSLAEAAFSVHKTERLVREYVEIIAKYEEKGYIMERIMDLRSIWRLRRNSTIRITTLTRDEYEHIGHGKCSDAFRYLFLCLLFSFFRLLIEQSELCIKKCCTPQKIFIRDTQPSLTRPPLK